VNRLRILCGLGALAVLGFVLNIFAIQRQMFVPLVYVPFLISVMLALLWAVLSIILKATASKEHRRSGSFNGIFASIIFLCICMVTYAFVRKWDRAWDLTEEGRASMAPQTVQVLQGLTQEVNVTGLFPQTEEREIQVARDKAELFLKRCAEISPNLKVTYMDPVKERVRAEAMGLSFADPKGSVVIKSGTRQRTISLTGDVPRLEERDFTNALINVLQTSEPKIGFLTGHGENDVSRPEMATVKQLLERESYKAEPMAIKPGEGGVLGDYDLLVINGLNAQEGGDLSQDELSALDAFAGGGGRLLVFVDPQFSNDPAAPRKRVLDWLQQRFGIVVGADVVIADQRIESRLGEITLYSDVAATAQFGEIDVPDVEFNGCYEQSSPITRGFDKQMMLIAACSVSLAESPPTNVSGTTLLRTLPYCYAETNLIALMQGKPPTRDPQEKMGSISLAASTVMQTDVPVGDTGQMKSARVVVVGDTEFITNETIRLGGNLNFFMNTVAWLTEREQLIAIRPTGRENQPIKLSSADETFIWWVAGLGVVQIVLIASFVMYLARRRYA